MLVHQVLKARWIRLPRERAVAANDRGKERRQLQCREQLPGWREWLVGEYGKHGSTLNGLERLDHARIGPRVAEQMGVVQLQEPRQTRGVERETRRRSSARRTSVAAPSPTMRPIGVFGQRGSAAFDDQRVRGICKVAAGIDQRTVEIESNQPL